MSSISARNLVAPLDSRERKLLSARERQLNTIVLTDAAEPEARVIRIVGRDGRTGHVMVYFLDTCTGRLIDLTGQVVYQYPGGCGDVGCP